jgi:hypothetical protein
MKPCKEVHIIQVIPRRGNTPGCDGRNATNVFRPREDIVPTFNKALLRSSKSDKADLSVL